MERQPNPRARDRRHDDRSGGLLLNVRHLDLRAINPITERVIGGAIAVHREMGPGLLESTYEKCMVIELEHLGLEFERQRRIPITYRGVTAGYHVLDLVVERAAIIELKAVKEFEPVFAAQMLSYLRLSGCRAGLVINFHKKLLTEGIHRFVL